MSNGELEKEEEEKTRENTSGVDSYCLNHCPWVLLLFFVQYDLGHIKFTELHSFIYKDESISVASESQ